jgi:hypothetical protein
LSAGASVDGLADHTFDTVIEHLDGGMAGVAIAVRQVRERFRARRGSSLRHAARRAPTEGDGCAKRWAAGDHHTPVVA